MNVSIVTANATNVTTPPVEYSCENKDLYVTTHRLFVYVIGPILLSGIFFNTLNIFVLRRTPSPSNAFFMLQFMAFSDILYLFVCLLYFPLRRLIGQAVEGDMVYKRGDWAIGPQFNIIIDPIYHMLLVTRNWMVVTITVERLFNIAFPLRARTIITRFRLKIIVCCVFLMGVALHTHKWFLWYLDDIINECNGEPDKKIVIPRIEIEHYIYISMTVVAPMCIIYIANVALILSLRRSFLQRAKIAGTGSKESITQQRQAIIIVLVMSTVFSVFETPACVDRLLYLFGVTTPATTYVRKYSLLLNILDSTVNFFAYCASSKPFRLSLMKLLKRQSRDSGGPSRTSSSKATTLSKISTDTESDKKI